MYIKEYRAEMLKRKGLTHWASPFLVSISPINNNLKEISKQMYEPIISTKSKTLEVNSGSSGTIISIPYGKDIAEGKAQVQIVGVVRDDTKETSQYYNASIEEIGTSSVSLYVSNTSGAKRTIKVTIEIIEWKKVTT